MFINQILTKLKSLVYSKSETDSLLNGKASSSHTHTKSQITDFPTIPSKVSQLTNDSGFITGVSWDNVSGKPSTFTPSSHTHTKSQITDFPTIPTNTNQLTNGAGFITSSGSCNYANSAGSSSIATRDSGGMWISGRDNAVVKQTRHSTGDGSSWNPAVSVKTKSGNWTIGTVGYDKLQFSYDTDEDYNTGNNRNTVVELNPESGTIITSANIGSQSVNYANSSGNADTLDGYHHDSFPKTSEALFTVNGLGSPGWSAIGTGTGGSCIQVKTTDNTYPSICFHRSGYSHCVLAESGGQLGTMQQGSETFNPLITSANIGSQNVNYANSAGGVAWGNVSGRPTALSQFTNDNGYITADGAAYPRRVGGVTMNFNWSGQGGQPTWLWGGEDGTNMYVYNPANFSVNYAANSGYTNWLRTSSHTDHLLHTEWDGSYFWTYVTASDGGYRAVRVERSNSSGWADSAGGVAWGNVSGRPTALSQFTNDSGFITSEIDSSGTGWVRFKCGIQICWGTIVATTQQISVTFGKAFLGLVSYGIGVCPSDNVNCWVSSRSATSITLSTEMGDGGYRRVDWLAIGNWK